MPLLHRGDVVGEHGQYTVQRRLGEGQFAEVWEVKLSDGGAGGPGLRFALKLEKRKDRNTVKQEYKALKRLSGTCSQVVAIQGCGTHDDRFYMVMQLLGETLYDIRKQAGGRLELPTVKAVGLSTLTAIEQVHQHNMIHRDIKPANFVINPPNTAANKGSWLLIDFGLARRYTDDSGGHLQPRRDASFRGSTTYASVHAHKDEDLSRRDDLWSWLYMLAELLDGGLPWRHDKDGGEQHGQVDKHWVLQQKELCIQDPSKLTHTVPLPDALAAISNHLASLGFADKPDYQRLRQCLQQLPDHQRQLHMLADIGHQSLPNGHQPWDDALDRRQQQQPQQQQLGLGDATGGQQEQRQQLQDGDEAQTGQQQQQQQVLLTPESPPHGQQSPPEHAASAAVAAVAAAKRPPPAADTAQPAKRRRTDISQPRKASQVGHQRQQRQGSTSLRSPAEDGSSDSRPNSRQGSAGARPAATRSADASAQRQASRQGSRRSRSRSRSRDRLPNWDRDRQCERERDREGRQLPSSRDGSNKELDRDVGAGAENEAAPAQEAAAAAALAATKDKHRQAVGADAAAAAGSIEGRAAEMADLVASFNSSAPAASKDAVQQTVEALLSLQPLDAVVAIVEAGNHVADQTDSASSEAVAQLMADLGAYFTNKAMRPRRLPKS